MTFAATIDENGALTLPKELREHLELTPHSQVEFRQHGGTVTLSKKISTPEVSPDERVRRMEAAIAKYSGTFREQMLAEGYNSVDEYMEDIRPPWSRQ